MFIAALFVIPVVMLRSVDDQLLAERVREHLFTQRPEGAA